MSQPPFGGPNHGYLPPGGPPQGYLPNKMPPPDPVKRMNQRGPAGLVGLIVAIVAVLVVPAAMLLGFNPFPSPDSGAAAGPADSAVPQTPAAPTQVTLPSSDPSPAVSQVPVPEADLPASTVPPRTTYEIPTTQAAPTTRAAPTTQQAPTTRDAAPTHGGAVTSLPSGSWITVLDSLEQSRYSLAEARSRAAGLSRGAYVVAVVDSTAVPGLNSGYWALSVTGSSSQSEARAVCGQLGRNAGGNCYPRQIG